jgi:hypothetical protein
MTFVLLVVGLLATAAGFVTLGFGISIHAFSLGNTLIVAGTIAVASGLILIGLAAVLGQLRRIAEALNARAMSRGSRADESVESLLPQTARLTPAAAPQPPMPPKMPLPPKPPEMHEMEPAMPRPPEPRFPAAPPPPSEPAPGPLDWLRAKPRPAASAPPTMPALGMMDHPPQPSATEPPMVEVPDEAPLSPRSPQRHAMPPVPEPAAEPRAWSPSRGNGAPQPMPRATPQPSAPEPPKEREGFDVVWPEPATAAPSERPAPEPKTEAPQPPPMPAPARPREEPASERRVEVTPRPAAKPASERTPAILKSGVIDGMPYTLYADGSIEAELPQGVVKFASVDALRAHLEKHG